MQTFLPYPDFNRSVRCLDRQRLGKQRVEAYQVHNAIADPDNGWHNHVVTRMWTGYEHALLEYMNCAIVEWTRRGYVNNMPLAILPEKILYPPWLGHEPLHSSHRANLLRKHPSHYSKLGWSEDPAAPYYWPPRDHSAPWLNTIPKPEKPRFFRK
ncbi:MAG: pyrimidine dimer DNA glycosylase/endonuclease V [Planctomycetota bacterium]|nr:pyrimidine dimer DNA glycosylase/endonuclease V [Planctomycetota bacterium]